MKDLAQVEEKILAGLLITAVSSTHSFLILHINRWNFKIPGCYFHQPWSRKTSHGELKILFPQVFINIDLAKPKSGARIFFPAQYFTLIGKIVKFLVVIFINRDHERHRMASLKLYSLKSSLLFWTHGDVWSRSLRDSFIQNAIMSYYDRLTALSNHLVCNPLD